MIDKPKTGITGVVPIDAEHGRYAYMVDGLTVWAGTKAKCELRFLLREGPKAGMPPDVMEQAIRSLG